MSDRPEHRERLVTFDALRSAFERTSPDAWLTAGERETLAELRDVDRRFQWLAGRWLAKELVREALAQPTLSGAEIHIQSSNGQGRADRPVAYVRGRQRAWSLSIAHTDDAAYVVLMADPQWGVGVDVAPARPLQRSLVDTWFTFAERSRLAIAAEPWLAAKMWAAKEAAYKALGRGESFAPRRIEISACSSGMTARWRTAETVRTCPVQVRIAGEHIVALAFATADAPTSETASAEIHDTTEVAHADRNCLPFSSAPLGTVQLDGRQQPDWLPLTTASE